MSEKLTKENIIEKTEEAKQKILDNLFPKEIPFEEIKKAVLKAYGLEEEILERNDK